MRIVDKIRSVARWQPILFYPKVIIQSFFGPKDATTTVNSHKLMKDGGML
jgi:hypothetical protein